MKYASLSTDNHARRMILAVVSLLFCFTLVRGQIEPPPAPVPDLTKPSPCKSTPGEKPDFADRLKCAKHIYDKLTAKDGFRVVIGSVAPGSGLAGGIGYGLRKPNPNWQLQLDTSARVSIKKYWEIDGNLRLTKTSSSTTAPVDISNLKIDIYGFVKDMPRVDFFGLGPNSREEDRAVFHYREAVIGTDISTPVNRALDIGSAVEGIWPDLIRIANPTVTSVERKYTEATAPGLTSQPPYFHVAAFARLHSRGQEEARKLEYIFAYHAYQDLGDHQFSFRRFNADLRNKFSFADKNEIRIRARVSLSETRVGQRVPFYLMETLGGSNISGDDTLRGFRDYRFRDRDFALLQVEYLRALWGPIDLITFYDTGKVASSISRFDEGRLRHTYGLGIVVVPRRLDNILFRFYVALGSGEGSHTYLGGGVTGRGNRLVR
jgi:hypothetical protein